MAEYIEKQRLLDFLDACIEEEKGTRHQVIVEAIKMTIERMPIADVDSLECPARETCSVGVGACD